MPSSATPTNSTPPSRYQVTHYGKSRNFALYEGKNLRAVTLYKKGAETVQGELEARDTVIAELTAQIEQLRAAAMSPGTGHSAPTPTRFRDRVWPEVNGQLGFFSREQKERFTAERRGSSRGRS